MPFDPKDRNIFTYFDGSVDNLGQLRVARADPIALESALVVAAGGPNAFDDLWKRAHATMPDPSGRVGDDGLPVLVLASDASSGQAALATVVRQAFAMPEFDSHGAAGLTDREVLDVLYEYYDWLQKKRVKAESLRNNSQPSQDSPLTFTL